MTLIVPDHGGWTSARRFIDRVVAVERSTARDDFDGHRHLVERCLAFDPVDTSIEVPAPGDPADLVLWKIVGADDTCRAIGTGVFDSVDAAIDDAAALRSGLERASIQLVVHARTGDVTWWAVLDGRVVCVSGRSWSHRQSAACTQHGTSTLRRLSRLQLRAATEAWWVTEDKDAEPQRVE